MNILEKYVDRMNAHDAQGIADCWVDEGCVFDDEAAKLLTRRRSSRWLPTVRVWPTTSR